MKLAMPVSPIPTFPRMKPLSLTLSRKREKGQTRKAILNPRGKEQTNRCASFTLTNETNIRDRSLPLLAARAMFSNEMVVREDTRRVYPERRLIGYATLAGRLMVVVFCQPSDERIHIISFRKANPREQKKFENQQI